MGTRSVDTRIFHCTPLPRAPPEAPGGPSHRVSIPAGGTRWRGAEEAGYYKDFGSLADLAKALERGFEARLERARTGAPPARAGMASRADPSATPERGPHRWAARSGPGLFPRREGLARPPPGWIPHRLQPLGEPPDRTPRGGRRDPNPPPVGSRCQTPGRGREAPTRVGGDSRPGVTRCGPRVRESPAPRPRRRGHHR